MWPHSDWLSQSVFHVLKKKFRVRVSRLTRLPSGMGKWPVFFYIEKLNLLNHPYNVTAWLSAKNQRSPKWCIFNAYVRIASLVF